MVSLILQAAEARATILPAIGGGVGSLVWRGIDILRPWSGREADGPFALAMNLLAPFSNRIGRPFLWDGVEHRVAPNLPGEAFPIHGDAFQRDWTLREATATEARLGLAGGIGPWLYDATVTYRLAERGLDCTLVMTNRGVADLPFGGGFHPWFPRSPETRLCFAATGCWPEDARHLPATQAPVPLPEGWGWQRPAPLPEGWINAGFAGWDGDATICQPGLTLRIAASGCGTAILYSPGARSGFFCFEPVSHPVDAHNLPGRPGLVRLPPGGELTIFMSLTWDST